MCAPLKYNSLFQVSLKTWSLAQVAGGSVFRYSPNILAGALRVAFRNPQYIAAAAGAAVLTKTASSPNVDFVFGAKQKLEKRLRASKQNEITPAKKVPKLGLPAPEGTTRWLTPRHRGSAVRRGRKRRARSRLVFLV